MTDLYWKFSYGFLDLMGMTRIGKFDSGKKGELGLQQKVSNPKRHIEKNIRVVLFDLDGTLLDSRDFLVRASYDIIEQYYPGKYST